MHVIFAREHAFVNLTNIYKFYDTISLFTKIREADKFLNEFTVNCISLNVLHEYLFTF